MAAFVSNEEYTNVLIDDILALLGVPSSWPAAGTSFVDSFITLEGETTALNDVGIGHAWEFYHRNMLYLPGIIIDPYMEIEPDRVGDYGGGPKSPAWKHPFKIYYVMERAATSSTRGTIRANPTRLVLARLGVIRGVFNDNDNYKNLGGSTCNYSECSMPTLDNMLEMEWLREDKSDKIAACMTLEVVVTEDLS